MAVWEAVQNEDWVLAYPYYSGGGTNTWIRRLWRITRFDQYPGKGGGTGTGIGRAIGAALANRGRLCLDFQPDGDLLYSTSALWTAASCRVPLLVMILNNHSYYNDEEHQKAIAEARGRPVENKGVGIRLENPEVDYTSLARAHGIAASGPFKTIRELRPALRRAVKAVGTEKRPYLLEVQTQPR
jgi:acetolactate synthase I/II/III large subunit